MTLTPRQQTVLELTADGLKRDEVARQMYVSLETVKTHLQDARQTLGARTTAQAVAVAFRQGLIQ